LTFDDFGPDPEQFDHVPGTDVWRDCWDDRYKIAIVLAAERVLDSASATRVRIAAEAAVSSRFRHLLDEDIREIWSLRFNPFPNELQGPEWQLLFVSAIRQFEVPYEQWMHWNRTERAAVLEKTAQALEARELRLKQLQFCDRIGAALKEGLR